MNKEYQYTYDETNFREKMVFLSEIILQKQSGTASYILLILLFLISGSTFFILNLNGPGVIIGPLFVLVGLIFAFRLIRYYFQRNQYEKLLQQTIDESVEQLNSTDKIIRIGFYDDCLVFRDDGTSENKREWTQMHSYLRTEDHLFIIFDNDAFTAYALNMIDLPSSDFLEICAFVEEKLSAHQLSNFSPNTKSNPELIDS